MRYRNIGNVDGTSVTRLWEEFLETFHSTLSSTTLINVYTQDKSLTVVILPNDIYKLH